MAGRTRRKPHTQIGQNGKGTGKPKPQKFPPYQTAGLPLELGQFPQAPPQIPNFLPNTAGFERGQSTVNDRRSLAESQYGIRTGMIQPQLNMNLARLDTDEAQARSSLDENLAERGVYTSGFRPTLYQRHITTPFGRQRQDLATSAAQQYTDAGLQYGQEMLGAEQDMMNLYNDRANDAYNLSPLSVPTGGYQLPNMPGPQMTSGVQVGGGGKTRPNKNRNRNRPRGRR